MFARVNNLKKRVLFTPIRFRMNKPTVCNGCLFERDMYIDEDMLGPVPETNEPGAKLIEMPKPSYFTFPQSAIDVAQAFIDSGFKHQHKTFHPDMYLTGKASDVGRDSFEQYFKPGPRHPVSPTPLSDSFPISPSPSTIASLASDSKPITEHISYPSADSLGSLASVIHMGPASAGPVGLVHGGAIATIADTLTYRCAMYALPDFKGFTVNLNVNYRNPIPVGVPFIVRANVDYTDHPRKVSSHFGIFSLDHSVLYSEGTALFVNPLDKPRLD